MHTTEQLNTALAGRYVVDHLIGEGGMATVYLARDIKHNRKVALKVLRPDLGAVVGVERFLSEIEVTANLQHPNLLPLFDSGEAGGLLFYVMPHVEGESLRARIEREKQLPVTDAVHIATAVGAALDYAHRHGVIHRDLKPENILMHDGEPLVADFGIALAVSNAGGNRITQTGLSLGTPQYMSPEQATGDRTIDARTDVYSLGAVVYEMLTGEPPHTGSTSQAVIARMLTEKPRAILSSRPNVPPYVVAAVDQALEKLPADRWATAKEFGEALAGTRPATAAVARAAPAPDAPLARRARVRELAGWAVALLGIGITWSMTRPGSAPPPAAGQFEVDLPDSLTTSVSAHSVAISRDGKQLAIIGTRAGERRIYLRRLEDPVAQPVRGTEGAAYHSFSPDGRSLVFNVGPALKTVPIDGGTPQTLADSALGSPASWGDGRTVLYDIGTDLWRVSSDGGDRRPVIKADTAKGLYRVAYPNILPGGTHAVASLYPRAGQDSARLAIIRISDGRVTELGILGRAAKYVSSGHLVFTRTGGFLYAVPFSLRSLRKTGDQVLVLEQVRQAPAGATAFDAALNGTIVYESGAGGTINSLFAVNRQGLERALAGRPSTFREPRVSPDGRRIAVRIGPQQYEGALWIYDVASGALSRLTPDSGHIRPEWTRDGKRVVFIANANKPSQQVSSVPWDGSGPPTPLTEVGPTDKVWDVAVGRPRGLSVLKVVKTLGAPSDLYVAPTDSLRHMRPLAGTAVDENAPRLSPNGKLVAYTSDMTGRVEVYVTLVPGPGPHTQVSIDGGTEPIWSQDGTLYFRGPARIMSATLAELPMLSVLRRDSLFPDVYNRNSNHASWDVMPNGREFVMTRGPDTRSSVMVIVNWQHLTRVRGASGAEQ